MENALVKGGVTVVAGGGSGIGRAVVEVFAESGSAVEFCSVDAAANEALETQMVGRGFDVKGTTLNASSSAAVVSSVRLRPAESARVLQVEGIRDGGLRPAVARARPYVTR